VRVNSDNEAAVGGLESGPNGAPYEDWMLWEPFISTTASGESYGEPAGQRVIDVKSMRKLEEINEQLTLWVDGTATVTFQFRAALSILLLLP